MAWIDVSQMALNLLANREKVAYLTESEILERPDIVENAKMDGLQVVAITEQQKKRLDFQSQTGGKQLPILETYIWDYNQSFEYNFVDEDKFTPEERQVFDYTPKILSLVNLKPDLVPPIRISETMRVTSDSTDGVWDRSLPAIIIKRTRLATLSGYAATLLHEIGHATTGAVDSTREFENVLTEFLGASSAVAIKNEIMYNH